MTCYFDDQEHQPSTQREQQLFQALPEFIEQVKGLSIYYKQILMQVEAKDINSRKALERLPITRKSDLVSLQSSEQPFAGIDASSAKISRVFQSPGPINDPENDAPDWWRMGRAFYAAGFRANDLVLNCLSYHLTPGGFIMDSGARACGCSVIPAGPGQTDTQLSIISSLKPQGYCGTPSFLKILLDKGKAENIDTSSITKALVTGEALPPSLRQAIEANDVEIKQAYASADVGLIAYESLKDDGLVVSEDMIVEIIRPGTQCAVADGEIGEIVVTSFNKDYPLIRFATGDLSAVLVGESSCGRTNMRIKGWLGRADQTAKIKGMFVHPNQVEQVRKSIEGIEKVRLVITNKNYNDVMTLKCEVANQMLLQQPSLVDELAATLKAITKLSGTVELVLLGSLADDGIVIEDARDYA